MEQYTYTCRTCGAVYTSFSPNKSECGHCYVASQQADAPLSATATQHPSNTAVVAYAAVGEESQILNRAIVTAAVFVPCAEDDPECCGGYTSHDGRSLAYVKESKVPVVVQGAAWVKASEFKAVADETVYCKINGAKRLGNFFEDNGKLAFHVAGHMPYLIEEDAFEMFYILDESGTTPSNQSDAKEFAEWLQLNRWFQFTGGYWYYTFEMGTAGVSEKTYNKHYRKTTAQLYEQFKNRWHDDPTFQRCGPTR